MICDRKRLIAEWVYRLMLLAYPPGFRQHYGLEMMEAFLQERERCQSDGLEGLLRFWLLILSDWAGSSLFRFYFPALVGLAFLICGIFFGGVTSTPSADRNFTTAQLVPAEPTKVNAVTAHMGQGHIATKVARAQSHHLHFSVRRQRRESRELLLGPSALAGGTKSVERGALLFNLIGDASIK